MSAWQNFRKSLSCYLQVPATLSKHRLWHYQLIPALVSLVITSLMFVLMIWLANLLRVWVENNWDISIAGSRDLVPIAVGIGAFLVMAVGFFFLHKHIVIVALAPFLGRIAEVITRAECGPQADTPMTPWQSLRRSAYINTRSVFVEIFCTILLLLIGIIPFLTPFTSAAIFFIGGRYAGNGLMDFPLEYRGLSVKESIEWSRSHKATAFGIGAGYQLLLMIPFLGWMFAPTFGTVAGTLRSVEEIRRLNSARENDAGGESQPQNRADG
jgi:CysZ protein